MRNVFFTSQYAVNLIVYDQHNITESDAHNTRCTASFSSGSMLSKSTFGACVWIVYRFEKKVLVTEVSCIVICSDAGAYYFVNEDDRVQKIV